MYAFASDLVASVAKATMTTARRITHARVSKKCSYELVG